jgi:hypothetical protein
LKEGNQKRLLHSFLCLRRDRNGVSCKICMEHMDMQDYHEWRVSNGTHPTMRWYFGPSKGGVSKCHRGERRHLEVHGYWRILDGLRLQGAIYHSNPTRIGMWKVWAPPNQILCIDRYS